MSMDPCPSLALHAQAAAWPRKSLVFFVVISIFVYLVKVMIAFDGSEYKKILMISWAMQRPEHARRVKGQGSILIEYWSASPE
jgi:hypothetical protein